MNSTRAKTPLLTDAMLDQLKDCTLNPLCLIQDWKCWLYCQLLRAAREGKTETVILLLTQIHKAFSNQPEECISEELVFSHLILEAVGLGHTSLVKSMCGNKLTPRPVIWIIRAFDGLNCNALECAALLGHANMVDLLLRKGCTTTLGFRGSGVVRSRLHSAVENQNTAVVKCLLAILTEPNGGPLIVDWDANQPKELPDLKVHEFDAWTPPRQHRWKQACQ
jgi:hypothetical protein